MPDTAHKEKEKLNVLISGVNSYLGYQLAKFLLDQNYIVYAIGTSKHAKSLISRKDFTLLEVDLSQPLPTYLPKFDAIFYLDLFTQASQQGGINITRVPPPLKNLIEYSTGSACKINILAPVSTDPDFYHHLALDDKTREKVSLFLIGDVYGPGIQDYAQIQSTRENELENLILQALSAKKIVMEKEGLKMVYPTYIDDALNVVNTLGFTKDQTSYHYVTSEEPKTSLAIAYDIQNIFSLQTNEHIDLFFAGQEPENEQENEPTIKVHRSFQPKVKLAEGLKNTINSITNNSENLLKPHEFNFTPNVQKQSSVPKPRINIDNTDAKEAIKEKLSKIPRLRLKFAKLKNRPKFRYIIVLVILIFISVSIKSAVDIHLAASALSDAKVAIYSGNLEEAGEKASSAQKSFHSASTKLKVLLYPFNLLGVDRVSNSLLVLEAAEDGSKALNLLVEGAKAQMDNISYVIGQNNHLEGINLESPLANFRRAYFLSAQAKIKTDSALESVFFSSKVDAANNSFTQLEAISQSALELTPLTIEFTGGSQSKTYLVLLLNNAEIRPGGGFIGNFGLISFENGKLKEIQIEDIYAIDGQLKEQIEPPAELNQYLGVDNFYLRDSNWSPDFVLNSATARDLFKKETGKNVDGVISIDLTFLENLLGILGPVYLDDYKEEVTSQNLFERGIYYSEIGFFPGSSQKKDFFTTLNQELMNNLINKLDPQGTQSILPIIHLLQQSLEQKHVMLTVDNPIIASFIKTKSWDRPLPPSFYSLADDSNETKDFLAISEANLSANKVNKFLKRKITYEMTIGRDADLVAQLKISYKNDSQAETWPAGKYVNFLRVYVPFAVDVISHKVDDVDALESLQITNSQNLTILANTIEIPINSTKEITYSYRIPKNINLEKAPVYRLYVQKQPGTGSDEFEFTFNLPGYLKEEETNKQNLRVVTNLETDRVFEYKLIQ